MAEPLFNRLCLVGIGLIGSSIARVAKKRGDIARTVVATARRPETLTRVRELGIVDVVEDDIAKAVEGCDCVILCVPVGVYADVMARIAPHLAPGCVLTDVGSTKCSVVRDLGPLVPPGVHLVPAHPMAGTASPSCSRAATPSSRRCPTATPWRWRRCASCGAAAAR
jgi:cyclohexadieny/prephenate dehydrogenase